MRKNQPWRGFSAESSSQRADCGACHGADNLTQQAVQKFSYETTPYVAIADAVRISMSIPFFFEARFTAV
ncbi:MAG TPA: hypothetical protein VGJ66_23970 [Pyrinomonadaceae bacterium]